MLDPTWPLTLYYDGACPLCAREIALLRRHAARERLQLMDIAATDFDPRPLGLALSTLQARLHARWADGRWLVGLDASLASWQAAGLGAWVAPLGWRALRPPLEWAIGCSAACARTWRDCRTPMVRGAAGRTRPARHHARHRTTLANWRKSGIILAAFLPGASPRAAYAPGHTPATGQLRGDTRCPRLP